MNLATRSYQKELLDNDGIPFDDLKQNLVELNRINRLLGGHNITIAGVKKLVNSRRELSICEIGCGGGDNMIAVAKWCKSQNITATFIGIDIKNECIEYARAQLKTGVTWYVSDYRALQFNSKPDIIFSSLFCHHFTNDEITSQLKWMRQNSRMGFFINDLHRHPLAYWSIKWLTKLFSRSYLVKNDAPLSVARGFRKNDWKVLLENAGLMPAMVEWKWAFRHLVTYHHE